MTWQESKGNKMLGDAIAQRTEASIQGHALGRNKTPDAARATRREIREQVIARLNQNHNLDRNPQSAATTPAAQEGETE